MKKGEASVILISRMLSTYGMRSRLSGFASGIDAFLLLTPDANAKGGGCSMTLLETLALLTLLATVGFGMFDIAWKIFNNKK